MNFKDPEIESAVIDLVRAGRLVVSAAGGEERFYAAEHGPAGAAEYTARWLEARESASSTGETGPEVLQ